MVEVCAGELPPLPPADSPTEGDPPVAAADAAAQATATRDAAFGREFWFAYLANAATTTALGMLVRYADFVTYLGGTEFQLGLIVGLGASGNLLMRLIAAVGMDRHGTRGFWLVSAAILVASIGGNVFITTVDGPAIYLLRFVQAASMAGVFGASMTHVSRLAPPIRMAEMIGTLGTSGFIGLLLGPQIADWICASAPETPISRGQLDLLFSVSAALCTVAIVCAICSTHGSEHDPPRRHPPLAALLWRYSSGLLLVVCAAVGAGLNLPGTFLRVFAVERGVEKIGLFFAVYAVTGFLTRLATRRVPERFGNRAIIIVGLALLVAGTLLYLVVENQWLLAIPGAAGGIAHALLFPSVVAGVSTAFPARYRGLGTTLALFCFDAGTLLGAPAIGASLKICRQAGWSPYPTTFALVALVLAAVGIVYWAGSRGKRR